MTISFLELEHVRQAALERSDIEAGLEASRQLVKHRATSEDLFWHAWLLMQIGRLPGAATAIRKALDQDPSNQEAIGLKALIEDEIAKRTAAGLPLDLVAERDRARRTWEANLMAGYNGVVDSHLLQDPEAWRELCRERGRNPGMYTADEWVRICTARGYSFRRHNSRGF
jgi:hypothetical protein